MSCPSVQVLSIFSKRDVIKSKILDVLAKALKSCNPVTPCGPYIPDVLPHDLPQLVEETRPDVVVLVSEHHDLSEENFS